MKTGIILSRNQYLWLIFIVIDKMVDFVSYRKPMFLFEEILGEASVFEVVGSLSYMQDFFKD
jgi:hypothetical protein